MSRPSPVAEAMFQNVVTAHNAVLDRANGPLSALSLVILKAYADLAARSSWTEDDTAWIADQLASSEDMILEFGGECADALIAKLRLVARVPDLITRRPDLVKRVAAEALEFVGSNTVGATDYLAQSA